MSTFFQAIGEKFTTDHNASIEYNNEAPGKGDYLCGKAQAYADVLDMLNSEYVEIKNYSPATPVQQTQPAIALADLLPILNKHLQGCIVRDIFNDIPQQQAGT